MWTLSEQAKVSVLPRPTQCLRGAQGGDSEQGKMGPKAMAETGHGAGTLVIGECLKTFFYTTQVNKHNAKIFFKCNSPFKIEQCVRIVI